MELYENPSAGKFGPPPGSDERFQPTPPAPKASRFISAGLLLIALRIVVDWYRGRAGDAKVWFSLLAIGLLVVDLFLSMKRRRDRGESPYSPDRHVTR